MLHIASTGQESKALDSKPDIRGSEFYWVAFYELGTCRSFGMGVGPIPYTAKLEYVRNYGLDDDEELEFMYIMNYLDNVFVKKVNDHGK